MTVTMDYFNASLNTFEPLMEYWDFRTQVIICEARKGLLTNI